MRRAAAVVALTLASGGVLVATHAGAAASDPIPAGPYEQQVQVRSSALATAPPLAGADLTNLVPASSARAVAAGLARTIPLPAGGTFDGVRWEESPAYFSRAQIAAIIEYNASCQWLRAWRDGRHVGVSGPVLTGLPSWPAWRGTETADRLAQISAEARSGGGRLTVAALSACDASHAREVEYATSRGLVASP